MNPVSISIKDNIALVKIANPPVNALSQSVRAGLLDAVERIDSNDAILAVVLICDGRTFVAGADISEFDKPGLEPSLTILISRLERASKPWIAAIHGMALGGGLELALSCHYRLADIAAKLGFPEVNLGLMPGAGGTVRLPRVIDCTHAVSMVSGGKPVSAQQALEWGMIDQLINTPLENAAMNFARKNLSTVCPQPTSQRPIIGLDKIESWDTILNPIKKKARQQIAPVTAAEAIRYATETSASDALIKESECFTELKASDQSKAMRYLFFAEKAVSRLPTNSDVKALPVHSIGVIGGGTMGAGIATALLLSGYQVIMIERDNEALDKGLATVTSYLDNSVKRGLIDTDKHGVILTQLSGSISYQTLSTVDMVIEAVFEDMAVKLGVFATLDEVTKPEAILATNTSYLDINQIAKSVNNPSRVVGLHFFSPAHIMKLLEIVRTDVVATEVMASAFTLAKKMRKVAVSAGVCDGFIGNRIMSAYRRECEYMLEDGALPQDIDKAMTDFGFPMGIFSMQDLAGLDISWAMRKRQASTRDPKTRYVTIADRLCEIGRLGRKTGSGWYDYDAQGKPDTAASVVERIIIKESQRKGIHRQAISPDDIIARILLTMQNEGEKVLAENIADTAEAIDVVMVNGYGFPRWKGGPMFLKNQII
jgi:3-hydroxyacyl-CoA dehydrogenase